MADSPTRNPGERGPIQRPKPLLPASLLGLLVVALLLAACNPQAMAQATQATQTASVSGGSTPTAAATSAPATSVITDATPAVSPTPGTPGPDETDTPGPTPTGSPPADPTTLLDVFNFVIGSETLVKRDQLNLEGDSVPEMLYTVSEPAAITQETSSGLAVLNYDPVYRKWNLEWQGPTVNGAAEPLPAAGRAEGYNGGDLLRMGVPVLALRTTTRDQRAHLYLYKWDASKHQGVPLKMDGANGSQVDARFDGDLDVNLADLNGDGVYEVIADNLKGVQTWKWDGSKFVQGGSR